ncbi:MAG: tetratricopeptide repeat protein [Polyangiaceae bacterium]|nr:tetratricopeptide repeat protein [Polyangiaceae bacterium]
MRKRSKKSARASAHVVDAWWLRGKIFLSGYSVRAPGVDKMLLTSSGFWSYLHVMQAVTKIWVAVAATFVLAGCREDAPGSTAGALPPVSALPAAVSAAPPPSASAKASSTLPKKKRPKTREAPNPMKMTAYRKHLAEGRRLASKSTFPEAIKEFEKALEAVPGDAPALLDLGWAAFKAGELDRAKKSTEEALARTTSPKLKGMAHYNLGRIAEEKKDDKTAVEQYRISLELRPNETVEKRLAEVAKRSGSAVAVKTAVEPLPCQTPAKTVADVCACMTKPQADDTAPRTCESLKDVKVERDDLAFIEVATTLMETYTYAVARNEQGFVPVAKVGWAYNPGAFGIYEEFTLEPIVEKSAGKTKVLWIEGTRNRHDSDMGIDEYEEETSKLVTLCVPPAGETKTWKCPLHLTTSMSYVRDRMGIEGFTPDDVTRGLMTKGLPVKSSWSLDVKLLDGKVEVTVASGKPPADVQALAKTHSL